jgi:hypothetical protein
LPFFDPLREARGQIVEAVAIPAAGSDARQGDRELSRRSALLVHTPGNNKLDRNHENVPLTP